MEFIWRVRQDFAYFHECEALNFLFITFCFGFGTCLHYTTWRHNSLLFSRYENIILILSQCENNSLLRYNFYLMDKTRYITFENVIKIIIPWALLHLLVFHLFSQPQKLFNSSLSVKKSFCLIFNAYIISFWANKMFRHLCVYRFFNHRPLNFLQEILQYKRLSCVELWFLNLIFIHSFISLFRDVRFFRDVAEPFWIICKITARAHEF